MKGRTYRYFEKETLYPFGYGLTYGDADITEVKYNDITVSAGSETEISSDKCEFTVTVKNNSDAAMQEIIQVYVKAVDSQYSEPNAKLCGFARVKLNAGESKEVKLDIDAQAFTVVTDEGDRVDATGTFKMSVGFAQPDKRTKELSGKECVVFSLKK